MDRKFTIHSIEKNFILHLDEMDAGEHSKLHRRLTNVPEIKFSTRYSGYLVPKTTLNMNYLQTMFEGEYELDDIAILEFEKAGKTHTVQQAKLKMRLNYEDVEPTYPYKLKPYKHQVIATNSLHGSEYFALLMGMGTGKTKCIIDEINWVGSGRIVVVCPKSVMGQWIKEFKKHCTHDYFICRLRSHHRGVTQMIEGMRNPAKIKVFIINYDRVKSMSEILARIKPNILVLDESHCIKNRNAKRTKACKELGIECDRRFILTGTPVGNTLIDLYAQFNFLQEGALGYSSFSRYKQHFIRFKKLQSGFEKLTGYRNVVELKNRMSQCSFTVKKEDCLDLPEKVYTTRTVEMTEKQARLYEDMVNIALASLEDDITPEGTVHATIVLVQLLRLSQIANGFIKTMSGDTINIPGGNPKIDAVGEWIDDLDSSEKAVIWARFHQDVDNLMAMFLEKGVSFTDLTGRTKNRDRSMEMFNSDYGPRVIIGEAGSGGLGVELLGTEKHPCTAVGYFSNDFSSLKRAQSEDRSHRIGTYRSVVYTDFIAEGTLDPSIAEILQNKKQLNEYIQDFKNLKALLKGMTG